MPNRSERLQKILDDLPERPTLGQLSDTVASALALEPPPGDPDAINSAAQECQQWAADVDDAGMQLKQQATAHIPTVWVSTAARNASALISLAATSAGDAHDALSQGATALRALADTLHTAQGNYRNGIATLQSIQQWLASLTHVPVDVSGALAEGRTEVADTLSRGLIAAAKQAEDAGQRAARTLRDQMGKAGAGQLSSSRMDPADRLVLTSPGADGTAALLPPYQAAAANDRLQGRGPHPLSASDSADFVSWVGGISDPVETALLYKGLAAGASLDDLRRMDDEYHRMKASYDWSGKPVALDKLAPLTGYDPASTSYGLGSWFAYDPRDDAATTVMLAWNEADPVHGIGNQHPDTVPYDPIQADINWIHEKYGDGPLTDQQLTNALNGQLGGNYQNLAVSSSTTLQDQLPGVTRALDSGRVVSVTAGSPTDQHHLLIIGHDGPNLKVFDPNAPTHERVYWVSSEDFTSGNVQGAPVTSIRVPHG